MGKRKLGALEKVDADLANLQNKIKRDPQSYHTDFLHQHIQYENQRQIFLQAPTSASDSGLPGRFARDRLRPQPDGQEARPGS